MMYADIARLYKYTFDEIASMTPFQQLCLHSPDKVSEVLYFETMEEYLEWSRNRR